ncbi:hypothetical protein [Polynucleobacter asymbioticus]|uniref:hypothetical protein n=1 Tax=Polynucleobacter asymbioticus TaxID=576611 RepID=UPI0012379DC8|nr:hypothetical protein [Polynucleobacter asymbioticus]
MKLILLLCTISLAILSGCSEKAPTNKHAPPPIVGEFKSKTFQVNESEHVTMFDMAGYWEPTRCWVWVDEKTKNSHMRCNTDTPEMPDHSN